MASTSAKDVVICIFAVNSPKLDLKRIRGSQLFLRRATDLSQAGGSATLISDPIELNECFATGTISRVPVGQYQLSWTLFRLETTIVIPEVPALRLQLRIEIDSAITLNIFDTIPGKKLQDEPCLLIKRVTFVNPEQDLYGLLRNIVTPFVEEGRPFDEGNLEKAISAINKIGIFQTLHRSDCRVKLSTSPSDEVDVTFHLIPK